MVSNDVDSDPGNDSSNGRMTDSRESRTELEDLIEHLERYRRVTLQVFDLIEDGDLAWRPSSEQYSLGQQLLHIAQAEDRLVHGLFEGDWSYDRVRFPAELPDSHAMMGVFRSVRAFTLDRLRTLAEPELGRLIDVPDMPLEQTLRSYLWFILEHELHHRGQIWAYLRAMGKKPPFYALALPLGERPDLKAREELGGF